MAICIFVTFNYLIFSAFWAFGLCNFSTFNFKHFDIFNYLFRPFLTFDFSKLMTFSAFKIFSIFSTFMFFLTFMIFSNFMIFLNVMIFLTFMIFSTFFIFRFLCNCNTVTINSLLEVGQFRQALEIFTDILIAISIDLEIGQHHYNAIFERYDGNDVIIKPTKQGSILQTFFLTFAFEVECLLQIEKCIHNKMTTQA
jgi:hypothetical protein